MGKCKRYRVIVFVDMIIYFMPLFDDKALSRVGVNMKSVKGS